MADYCVLDDVSSTFPTAFWDQSSVNANPAPATVSDWITQASREIDSKLAGRYTVPITGPESLEIVKSIAARIVAIRLWGVIIIASAGNAIIPEDWRQARRDLDAYAAGTYSLPDAPGLGATTIGSPGAPAGSFSTLGPDPYEGVERQPIFTERDVY